jgi:hypothetical protein
VVVVVGRALRSKAHPALVGKVMLAAIAYIHSKCLPAEAEVLAQAVRILNPATV